MRIVHVAGSAAWAGGERQLLDLIAGLDRRRFELRVILPEPGPLRERLEGLGVAVRVVPLRPLGSLKPARELTRLLRRWAADIVQSHGARSNFYARVACGRLGLPHVATVHNSLFDYPVSFARKAVYLAADRALSSRSARIVCVSKALRRDLTARLLVPADRVEVIPNGVDAEAFSPKRSGGRLRAELGIGREEKLFGVVGRLTTQKGHRFFLEAFKRVVEVRPEARGVFVGDGPLSGELRVQALRLGLGERVRFAGVRRDVPSVLAALDAVVLPSLSEGLPYVLLEAMAMERPVVATAVNGVPEAMDPETGILIPPRDPAALAGAMRSILAEPAAARRRAVKGRRSVMERFSVKSMVEAWSDLYDRVGAA